MTGFGRLFADDTCIGHMAHNEENLHTQTVSKALLISAKVILVICFFYPTQVKYYHKVQLTYG
jgi:predicted histidine transporter YuiF (NhaC family)